MKKIKLKDKEFEISVSSEKIRKAIDKLAKKINKDYKNKFPFFIVVLDGAFVFAADLIKKITIDCEVTFVKLSSYTGTKSSKNVETVIGLNKDIERRHVIIVEDVVDTGTTCEIFMDSIRKFRTNDVKIVTLFFKPEAFKKNYKVNYAGIEIPDDFIVGYGLDYKGLGRNLPDIYKVVSI